MKYHRRERTNLSFYKMILVSENFATYKNLTTVARNVFAARYAIKIIQLSKHINMCNLTSTVHENCLPEEYLATWRKTETKRKNAWEVNIVFVSFVFHPARLDDVFSLAPASSSRYE